MGKEYQDKEIKQKGVASLVGDIETIIDNISILANTSSVNVGYSQYGYTSMPAKDKPVETNLVEKLTLIVSQLESIQSTLDGVSNTLHS